MKCHYTTNEPNETGRNVCGATGRVFQVRREGYVAGAKDPVCFHLTLCDAHAAEVRHGIAGESYVLEEVSDE